jgi:hypothetical protein
MFNFRSGHYTCIRTESCLWWRVQVLKDRNVKFPFPAGLGEFPVFWSVQTDSGAYQSSYSMESGETFPGSKAALWNWSFTSIPSQGYNNTSYALMAFCLLQHGQLYFCHITTLIGKAGALHVPILCWSAGYFVLPRISARILRSSPLGPLQNSDDKPDGNKKETLRFIHSI